MYKIVNKQDLNPTVSLLKIEAPAIARKAKPGQFIILRVDEDGERIPLTIADHDNAAGTDASADNGDSNGGTTVDAEFHEEDNQ